MSVAQKRLKYLLFLRDQHRLHCRRHGWDSCFTGQEQCYIEKCLEAAVWAGVRYHGNRTAHHSRVLGKGE